MNMLALQLATHGRVDDFTVANHIREELWGTYAKDWETYDATYGQALRAIQAELSKLI